MKVKKTGKKWEYKLDEYSKKAIEIAKAKGLPVTCRCGETPGGTKHIGNFNDNMRSYFLYLIIKRKGYPARHVQTRDNLDPFRKLPWGFADLNKKWHVSTEELQQKYDKYVGTPLFFMPDPLGCCKNYAEHFRKIYEGECAEMGLTDTKYFSTEELYRTGKFNPYLKKIFENISVASKIDTSIESTKPKGYVPVWVICEKCRKITGKITKIMLKEEKVEYVCSDRNLTSKYCAYGCGHAGVTDWKNGKTKMDWEFEWPAQMLMLQTTIEPFGKEHYIGSWPFATKVITEVYKEEIPFGYYYEYFLIKGQKMATRHGNVITLTQLMEILEPEVIRFLYTKRWKVQRNLDLTRIFRLVDEFDRAERIYFGLEKAKNAKEETKLKKGYELAMLFKIPKQAPEKISYRNSAFIAQSNPPKKFKGAVEEFSDFNKSTKNRLLLAKKWAESYAIKEFKVALLKENNNLKKSLNENQKKILRSFHDFFSKNRSEEEIWSKIKSVVKAEKISLKELFNLFYKILFGKDHGPNLPRFLSFQKTSDVKNLLKV